MIFNINKCPRCIIFLFLIGSILFINSCNKANIVEDDGRANLESGPPRNGPNRTSGGIRDRIGIKAITMKPKSIYERITVGARVQSEFNANVTSNISGKLTSITVKEGQYVQKNTILLYIDASKAGQQFLPSPILSPISGIVASLPIQLGNQINTSTVVAIVSNPTQNKVHASVAEKFALKMKLGQTATLSLSEFPDKKFDLVISEVSAKLSEKTQSLDIVLDFQNKNTSENIVSGIYGSVNILIAEHPNTISISRSMLIIRKNKQDVFVPGVFLVNNPQDFLSQVTFVAVTTGIEDKNTLEVLSGIKENDVVISAGQNSIFNNSEVYVLNLDNKQRKFPPENVLKVQK